MIFGGLLVAFYLYMSRYVEIPISNKLKASFNHSIVQYVFLFALLYTGFKDCKQTLLIFSIIILFKNFLLNRKSKLCVKARLVDILDDNDDGKVSADEIDKMIKVLEDLKSKPRELNID